MRKLSILFIESVLFFLILFTGQATAAVNCSDCHHIDFQNKVDRSTVCKYCHTFFKHYAATYQAPDGSWFKSRANAESTDASFIHNQHKTADQSACESCHGQVKCTVCHTSVSHTNHSIPTYSAPTYDYSDGVKWYKTTNFGPGDKPQPTSCAISQCHKWYTTGGPVLPSSGSTPLCLNCHSDPHGEQPSANDAVGVNVYANAGSPLTQSDITIKWQFQTGDSFKKSLDGLNWTPLNIGSPTPGNYYSYTDTGILNWSIVYYKITHLDLSENYFPVYPPGNNAHTNYLENTQLCALCHVTHSAEQPRLLKQQTTEDLCRTCHGLANTGSRYNVDTGETVVAGSITNGLITAVSYKPSNSGAFGIESDGKLYAGNHTDTWGGAEVTSTHDISSFDYNQAPGGGGNNIKLTCTSCHLSHPKKNSYRLLTIGNVQAFAVNTDAMGERVNYIKNMNIGCGCHKQYIADSNSGNVSAMTYFEHSTGVAIQGPFASQNPITNANWSLTTTLPTEYMDSQNRTVGTISGSSPVQYVNNGAVFCLSCHYAHGSTATGKNISAYDLNGDSLLNDYSTVLKRKANNAACQDCHQR